MKSEQTRELIRGVALQSFREQGFDATTMRSIATQSGVSLGNAYYYFPTKNHLVQELYLEVQEAHRAAAVPLLADVGELTARLGVVLRTGLDQLAPFHEYAAGFLTAMVAPASPLNPMSPESAPARAIVVALFREAVDGAKQTLPADFASRLPKALWLAYLLLCLFWSYDRSPGQRNTTRLVDQGLKLFKAALPLLRVPGVRAPLRTLLDLVGEVGA
ncbi:TetR/AcrR family transcriptional regulator [Gryllotalpicola protaetiae]|uniref:TetR/AcrR family transcriptional regulator n=1 Tax=Gryllotalpicola protaetiae TaxID=2419771 RepID=A0A387BQV9_9MICO|nr:TetR family transcriptional regulator [Gryllotalpicola protaetiae]AYG04942.1 TetR/AcrR family transcriptional regulator [Gryllotalpicola protaetiae]